MHETKYKGATLWSSYMGPGRYVVDVYRGGHMGAGRGATHAAALAAAKRIAD